MVADPKSRAAAITWCESVLDPSDILPILLDLESLFICESVVLIDLGRFFAPEISKNRMSIYTFVGRFYNYLDSLIDSLDISLLCRTNCVNCNFNQWPSDLMLSEMYLLYISLGLNKSFSSSLKSCFGGVGG